MIDLRANPVVSELLFVMLKDQNMDRPSAAQLLSKNRSIHYFSYICDLKIGDEYLPGDINLLQVFSSNEQFVPHLIKFGM